MVCSFLKIDMVTFPAFACVWQDYDFTTKFHVKMALPLVVGCLLMIPVPVVWCISTQYSKHRRAKSLPGNLSPRPNGGRSYSSGSTPRKPGGRSYSGASSPRKLDGRPVSGGSTVGAYSIPSTGPGGFNTSFRVPKTAAFVYKKGDWKNPAFQSRYFVLQHTHSGPTLEYFLSEDDSRDSLLSRGSLSVQNMKIVPDFGVMEHKGQKLHCFSIQASAGTTKRPMVCGCEFAGERKMWTDALSQASENAHQMKSAETEDPAMKWKARYHKTVIRHDLSACTFETVSPNSFCMLRFAYKLTAE